MSLQFKIDNIDPTGLDIHKRILQSNNTDFAKIKLQRRITGVCTNI
jgi:hypothetical protein